MGINSLFKQLVTVKPYLGVKNSQPSYGAPAIRRVFVNDGAERIKTAAGVELVSSSTLYDTIDSAGLYPPDSVVTIGDRTAHVVSVFRRDSAGPQSAWHVQVVLK